MIAYKFLGPERVGLFSGLQWPEQGEVRAAAPVDACRSGIHACRVGDLPFWIDDELWEVELEEPVVELERLVVSEAATVRRQVESWDPAAFAAACLEQVRAAATTEHGLVLLADIESLSVGGRPDGVEPIAGAGGPTPGALAANLGFVTAHALGEITRASGGDYDDAFATERERQRQWFESLLS